MKNLIIVVVLLVGAYFLVTKVVDGTKKLEDNNDMHTNYIKKKVEDKDKKYHKVDSLGQDVFVGTGLSLQEKKDIWSRSPLKDEMISKFPKFDLMYSFTRTRIEDSDLRRAVDKVVKGVETKFLSGSIDANEARYQLGLIE